VTAAFADAPAWPGDTIPAVSCRGLSKRYGRLWALRSLDLDVPAGSSFGLIGPNGAGKSTTFGILATLLVPTAGSAWVLGLNPATHARRLRQVLGYMPDVMGLYDNLTVEEYLRFYAAAYRLDSSSWSATIDGLLELVNLDVKRDDQVDDLSRGMKQRLSLARALVHDPQVLVLDEPASGLDPRARVELRSLLVELRRLGKTVVISSHILSELEEMCTHVAILEAGRLLAAGEPDVIRSSLAATRSVVVTLAGGEQLRYTVSDEAEQVALVRRLVELHLRFHGYGDDLWTDSAVRRYATDAGPLLEKLNELTRCDCTTRNQRKAADLAKRMDLLEERIAHLREREELDRIRPDLDGNQIMAHLGIGPGRDVGQAWKFLYELRLEEGPLGEEEARRRLDRWWAARQG